MGNDFTSDGFVYVERKEAVTQKRKRKPSRIGSNESDSKRDSMDALHRGRRLAFIRTLPIKAWK